MPTPPGITEVRGALEPACSGAGCAALSANDYAGNGVGIWRYTNNSQQYSGVPVTLNNVAGKTITYIYTNPSPQRIAMPQLNFSAQSADIPARNLAATGPVPGYNQVPARVRDFRSPVGRRNASVIPPLHRSVTPQFATVGSSRQWYIDDGSAVISSRRATLQRKLTASDGRVVNFWVENGEYGSNRLTAAHLDQLANKFANGADSVYSMVTTIAGAPWGEQPYPYLLPPQQELDVVLVNFDRNNRPYGLLGYFWALNNVLRDASDPLLRYSNESLSFYMDTETIYLTRDSKGTPTDDGLKEQISTLAHELTHMINTYQRGILLYDEARNQDYSFETFLEEMTALMMEDWVGLRLDPTHHSIRDGRFREWLANAAYNCNLAEWQDNTSDRCFSYNVAGSLGAFLLRQYGMDFYRGLLRNSSATDSISILDNAIRAADPASGLGPVLQRWGTGIALLPAATSPAGYAYPERAEAGFRLPAINGPDFRLIRALPTTQPVFLQGYGHFAQERRPFGYSHVETVPVPPGVTLSVVVQ